MKLIILTLILIAFATIAFTLKRKKNFAFWKFKTPLSDNENKAAIRWYMNRLDTMLEEHDNLKEPETLPVFYFDDLDDTINAMTQGDFIVLKKFRKNWIQHESVHFVLEHNGHPADQDHMNIIGQDYYYK